MSVAKFLILLGFIGAFFYFWQQHKAQSEIKAAIKTSDINRNGFISIPTPSNLNANTVIVLAAENCPKEDAKRADKLATELGSHDIPFTRAHSANFQLMNPDPLVVKRIDILMNGALPIVFVSGRAKNNPTLDEVLWEYRSTRQ